MVRDELKSLERHLFQNETPFVEPFGTLGARLDLQLLHDRRRYGRSTKGAIFAQGFLFESRRHRKKHRYAVPKEHETPSSTRRNERQGAERFVPSARRARQLLANEQSSRRKRGPVTARRSQPFWK